MPVTPHRDYRLNRPYQTPILEISDESPRVKSFRVKYDPIPETIQIKPGQFVMVWVPGIDEIPMSVSQITEDGILSISVAIVGDATRALSQLLVGDNIGIRGPYGNSFPLDEWKSKNIFIIGGGIGLAPLRPIIDHLMKNRNDFGHIDIVFGARSPQDILFKEDLEKWKNAFDTKLVNTIDIPSEGWNGTVGFVPEVVKNLAMKPDDRIAITCGPPIMIKYTAQALKEQKWQDEKIFTTLEMKMQCGIGQCGRCNIGSILICKDGPVFNLKQVAGYELS